MKPASSEARKTMPFGGVVRHAEPADGVPRHGLLTHLIDVIGAEIAGPG
jgi:hypothetical protein